MYEDLYANDQYKRFKESSVQGSSARRTGEVVKIKKSTYKRNLKMIAAATALATSLIIGSGANAYTRLKESATINSLAYQFHSEVITPETHRTQDNQHYFYDYDDIADRIESMDNPDIGYYLFYKNTGTYQTDKVLQETSYHSFDAYLEAHNFENEKEFSKAMAKVTLLDNEINNKTQELETITNEMHNTDDSDNSYGGAK